MGINNIKKITVTEYNKRRKSAMSANATNNTRPEEEMRIAKMISEGGIGAEAYYYYQKMERKKEQRKNDMILTERRIADKKDDRQTAERELLN